MTSLDIRNLALVVLLVCGLQGACRSRFTTSEAEDHRAPAHPWFVEEANSAGIDFVYKSGFESRHLFPEIMGGGVALGDFDGDLDLDIYFVQGGSLLRPTSDASRNQLYRNDGSGRFQNVSRTSGADVSGYGMGVATGDYDRDGDIDLYVTNVGRNTLLRNDGNLRFTDITEAAGVGHAGWSTGAAFVDVDRDGLLDIFVVNYIRWSAAGEIDCYSASGVETYCSPNSYDSPAPDALYLNRGGGRFEDVSHRIGLSTTFGNGLGIVASDFDDDGFMDIFVANDQTPNQLWHNQNGTSLVDIAVSSGCAVDPMGKARAGMGTTSADMDGDLDLDLLVVNLQAQSDSFFRNEGSYFIEDTAAVGLALVSRPFTRFGVGVLDFDNDGRFDLYQANGRVTLPEVLPSPGQDPYAEINLLYRGVDSGRFQVLEKNGGIEPPLHHTSRGTAFGDVDNDGAIDIIVVNRDGPIYYLRNLAGRDRDWIGFRILDEHGSDALGAKVYLQTPTRTIRRDVRTASSYLAASDPRIHVGLEDESSLVDVEVVWPDGVRESFGPQARNRYTTLVRTRTSGGTGEG